MVVAEWTEVESSNKPAHIPYITNMVEKHREEDEDFDDISLVVTVHPVALVHTFQNLFLLG
jgi:hypothetical protein